MMVQKRIRIQALCLYPLLLLPFLFISLRPEWGHLWRSPTERIIAGDETHYLLMLASLKEDHDLEVSNNYVNPPLSLRKRLSLQSHHTWVRDSETGQLFYFGEKPLPEKRQEYSKHGFGLPLLAFAFLGWTRLSAEWALRLTNLLLTFLALLFFTRILKERGEVRPLLLATLFLVCTPLWHYSTTMFVEPALLFCMVMVLWCCGSVKKRPIWASAVVLFGTLCKLPFILFLLPVLYSVRQSGMTGWWRVGLLPVLGILGWMGLNDFWFGSFFHFNQLVQHTGFIIDPPRLMLKKGSELLFSYQNGLFIFVPFMLFLLYPPVLRRLFSMERLLFWLPWFLMMVAVHEVHNGCAYGPRLLVPLLPLFVLALQPLWARLLLRSTRIVPVMFAVLGSLSFLISLQSVLFSSSVYAAPPWVFALHLFR
ncbi:MAG: hypothetical protein A2293_15980 [Elusimicrobia bacterium RIFOXYB2_FULL_49_7]|nr:MAG: hypothetical protein A2293_15980 [Elusimicrobia bacterium RIFOXYB2_FULL_49_7]